MMEEVEQARTTKEAIKVTASLMPEFLHGGAWPAAAAAAAVDQCPSAVEEREDNGDADDYPHGSVVPDIDEDGSSKSTDDSAASGRGSSISDQETPPSLPPLQPAPSLVSKPPTWKDLSAAVNTWKINDEDSRPEGEVENSRTPYSVLKLLARHGTDSQRHQQPKTRGTTTSDIQKFPRQNLFDQEIRAEGQARVEITEYIDSLVDRAEYEEAYACVWPLEEYRRRGWATEMITAYPAETTAFIESVNNNGEQSSRRRQPVEEARPQ